MDGELLGSVGPGLLALVAVHRADLLADAERLAAKTAELRIFAGAQGKMQHTLLERGGEVLSVSQFTLYAQLWRGRRPDFTEAAASGLAEALCRAYNQALRGRGLRVCEGRFGAHMQVALVNDGPATFWLDSRAAGSPENF